MIEVVENRLLLNLVEKGWCHYPSDKSLTNWIEHCLPYARKVVSDPKNSAWMRYGKTWFAGVNVLANDSSGSIDNGPTLQCKVTRFLEKHITGGNINWDPGQISVCYPGYPKPMESESKSAFQYRLRRDAAHIDGLLPIGKERRRYLKEHHAFILGIPLVDFPREASPFVLWEGSHILAKKRFETVFRDLDVNEWGEVDITNTYHQLRNEIFASCRRIEIHCKPGESFIVDRHALHGTAPWQAGTQTSTDGRMICYFRPNLEDPVKWLK